MAASGPTNLKDSKIDPNMMGVDVFFEPRLHETAQLLLTASKSPFATVKTIDAVPPELVPSVPPHSGTTHQIHGARFNSGVESLVQFYERLSQNVSLSESNKSKPYMRKSTASAHYDFTPQPLQLTPSEPSVEPCNIQPQLDNFGSSRNFAIADVHGDGGIDCCQMDDCLRRTSHGGFVSGFSDASSSVQDESAEELLADAEDRDEETLL